MSTAKYSRSISALLSSRPAAFSAISCLDSPGASDASHRPRASSRSYGQTGSSRAVWTTQLMAQRYSSAGNRHRSDVKLAAQRTVRRANIGSVGQWSDAAMRLSSHVAHQRHPHRLGDRESPPQADTGVPLEALQCHLVEEIPGQPRRLHEQETRAVLDEDERRIREADDGACAEDGLEVGVALRLCGRARHGLEVGVAATVISLTMMLRTAAHEIAATVISLTTMLRTAAHEMPR